MVTMKRREGLPSELHLPPRRQGPRPKLPASTLRPTRTVCVGKW